MSPETINLIAASVTIIGFVYGFLRNFKNDLEKRFDAIDKRFDKLETRMHQFENDMIEVKTILRMQECCMIKNDNQIKKAE